MLTLGLDIGTSSIGWCILMDGQILGIGVRAFPAKQGISGQSPYQQYNSHRAARRKTKAVKDRLKRLAEALVQNRLLPVHKSTASIDTRQLLLLGQSEPLTSHQLGAALMFLGKHKGSAQAKPGKSRPPFNDFPVKNDPWQRRDATRLFAKLWRMQSAFCSELTKNQRIAIARCLFSQSKTSGQYELKDDLAPYRTANQLNQVLDAIILKFGLPQLINTELFKLPENQILKHQRDTKEKPDKRAYKRNLIQQLWQELPEPIPGTRQCVYSGDLIHDYDLDADMVQVDHIVPRSRGGSNRKENLLLCTKKSNLEKGCRIPSKVADWQKTWPDILQRAQCLPANKRLIIEGKKESGSSDQYNTMLGTLSRRTWRICHDALANRFRHTATRIVSTAGHETAKQREIWHLDPLLLPANAASNRHDQRHHAIDAFVLAAIASRQSDIRLGSQLKNRLAQQLPSIVTSYKVDHKNSSVVSRAANNFQSSGFLAHETAYGPTNYAGHEGRQFGVIRKPISALTKPSDLALIRDALLRKMLIARISEKQSNQNELDEQNIIGAFDIVGPKRIRVLEPILNPVAVTNQAGKVIKFLKPGANHRFDVWQLPNGKWRSETITLANFHDPTWQSSVKAQYPTARKILKLHHNDCVAVNEEMGVTLLRVAKFCANDRIYLVPINAAGDLKYRDADPSDQLSYKVRSAAGLKHRHARQVRIDILGQVFDPGFQLQNLEAKSLKYKGVS